MWSSRVALAATLALQLTSPSGLGVDDRARLGSLQVVAQRDPRY
ncbi:hypothetical protein DB31_3292 [Hyalangium minutum]|uniref:Uncharacterized protein n=1 Tax=Hyalangium minutum TaxID=394096 RepID=A0A085WTZ9_9BACT|nr:hypothetical protein DB31_3292 [Hyalangium minutum]